MSILALSVHFAVQIFRGLHSVTGSTGLQPYKNYTYASIAIISSVISTIPFMLFGSMPYVSNYAFCQLPQNSFWYRLILGWIPRFIIWIVVIVLTTATCIYVVYCLGRIPWLEKARPKGSWLNRGHRHYRSPFISLYGPSRSGTHNPRTYTANIEASRSISERNRNGMPVTLSRNGSLHEDSFVATLYDSRSSNLGMVATQRRVHRKLLTLFVYPAFYILLWIVPLVNVCRSYSAYGATHPLYPLLISDVICRCIMGAVNVCVFILREQPFAVFRSGFL